MFIWTGGGDGDDGGGGRKSNNISQRKEVGKKTETKVDSFKWTAFFQPRKLWLYNLRANCEPSFALCQIGSTVQSLSFCHKQI